MPRLHRSDVHSSDVVIVQAREEHDASLDSCGAGGPGFLRYASRSIRVNRAFTAIAVLSLALGIGATTTVFTLVNSLMFRALPVRDPGQLVELLGNTRAIRG